MDLSLMIGDSKADEGFAINSWISYLEVKQLNNKCINLF